MIIDGYLKSTYEAADIIGVSYNTILNWIRRGIFNGVVEQSGYLGRPQQYIPADQVYLAKKLREEDGIKRMRIGLLSNAFADACNDDLMTSNTELVLQKIDAIQNKMIELYAELDQLKKLCE